MFDDLSNEQKGLFKDANLRLKDFKKANQERRKTKLEEWLDNTLAEITTFEDNNLKLVELNKDGVFATRTYFASKLYDDGMRTFKELKVSLEQLQSSDENRETDPEDYKVPNDPLDPVNISDSEDDQETDPEEKEEESHSMKKEVKELKKKIEKLMLGQKNTQHLLELLLKREDPTTESKSKKSEPMNGQ